MSDSNEIPWKLSYKPELYELYWDKSVEHRAAYAETHTGAYLGFRDRADLRRWVHSPAFLTALRKFNTIGEPTKFASAMALLRTDFLSDNQGECEEGECKKGVPATADEAEQQWPAADVTDDNRSDEYHSRDVNAMHAWLLWDIVHSTEAFELATQEDKRDQCRYAQQAFEESTGCKLTNEFGGSIVQVHPQWSHADDKSVAKRYNRAQAVLRCFIQNDRPYWMDSSTRSTHGFADAMEKWEKTWTKKSVSESDLTKRDIQLEWDRGTNLVLLQKINSEFKTRLAVLDETDPIERTQACQYDPRLCEHGAQWRDRIRVQLLLIPRHASLWRLVLYEKVAGPDGESLTLFSTGAGPRLAEWEDVQKFVERHESTVFRFLIDLLDEDEDAVEWEYWGGSIFYYYEWALNPRLIMKTKPVRRAGIRYERKGDEQAPQLSVDDCLTSAPAGESNYRSATWIRVYEYDFLTK